MNTHQIRIESQFDKKLYVIEIDEPNKVYIFNVSIL